MAEIIQLGSPPIDITVKHSSRARRISLRVSGADGRVSLTLPRFSSLAEAQSFLREKEGWIRKHLAKRPEAESAVPGALLPVEGRPRRIVEGATRAVRLGGDQLVVPFGAEKSGARIKAFLRTLARDRLAEASGRYAGRLGRSYGRLTLRDTTSRWGSCTSEGNLMYSWRLILAPPEVLDYVAAHEVAHLAEMNHSPAFWRTVEGLLPGYEPPRRWLKANGAELHRYRF